MENYILVPRGKKTWVGKKYENALLVGFGKDNSLILLSKMKGKPRCISRSAWSSDYWKIP